MLLVGCDDFDWGETARFKARIPPHYHEEFAPFVVRELQAAL